MSEDRTPPAREEEAERTRLQGENATNADDSRPLLHRVRLEDHPDALQRFLESLPGPVTIESEGVKRVPNG